jgi:DHA1 family inner membrane transport protein
VKMPIPLIALALSAFAIGTTEFVIMGLLPQVAGNLSVSIPAAGWLVSGYALGVLVGAPIMALATQKLPHRSALLVLMGIFILGNALCAIAPSYGFLMGARIITALCHGAFFGIGAVEAASLVPEQKRASAIALMFTGLTLANVLGVPAGTALGQFAGWRATFWAVTVIGVAAFIGLAVRAVHLYRAGAQPSHRRLAAWCHDYAVHHGHRADGRQCYRRQAGGLECELYAAWRVSGHRRHIVHLRAGRA